MTVMNLTEFMLCLEETPIAQLQPLVASRESESKITGFYAFFKKVRNMKIFNIKFQLEIIF